MDVSVSVVVTWSTQWSTKAGTLWCWSPSSSLRERHGHHASSCNTSYSCMELPLTVATCVEAGQTSQGLCQFSLVHKSPLVRLLCLRCKGLRFLYIQSQTDRACPVCLPDIEGQSVSLVSETWRSFCSPRVGKRQEFVRQFPLLAN